MKRKALWLIIGALVTVWQFFAGIARCGTVDGGVLLAPLILLLVMLYKGVARDLRQAFAADKLSQD